jgi:hypothetical protein
MDRLVGFLLSSVPSVMENPQLDCQFLKLGGAVVSSFLALYLGYLYLLTRSEAPVKFDVPLPSELRPGWEAKTWDDVKGQDKKILEGQVQGVSSMNTTHL